MIEYTVRLSIGHAVNEFGEISGVIIHAKDINDLHKKMEKYVEYMAYEEEVSGSYTVTNNINNEIVVKEFEKEEI